MSVIARVVGPDRYEVVLDGTVVGFAWWDDSVREWAWRVGDKYGKGRNRDEAVMTAAKHWTRRQKP